MDTFIYWPVRALVAIIQVLPLRFVAWLGRGLGGLAFYLTARYRRVTRQNLTMVFGREKSPQEIQALARENFRNIGENYLSAMKTAAMTAEEWKPHVEFVGGDRLPQRTGDAQPPNLIMA